MTMMPSAKLSTQTPGQTPGAGSHIDDLSTWRELAGHWLRGTIAAEGDPEADARRLAAVRRWRGLDHPGTGAEA